MEWRVISKKVAIRPKSGRAFLVVIGNVTYLFAWPG